MCNGLVNRKGVSWNVILVSVVEELVRFFLFFFSLVVLAVLAV